MLGGIGFALVLGAGSVMGEPGAAAPGVKPVTAVEPSEDAVYDSVGRRDPFRPPNASATTSTGEALQRYELGQLKLVAVIYDTHDPRAVVEDDEGLGYIVRVGTPIGAHGGEVHEIQQGRVMVKEDAVDYYGEHHPSEVTLELKASERGKR